MMAGSHVVLGGAAWAAWARLGGLEPEAMAAGLGAAALGALLPDIDHPESWVGRKLWPVSRPLSLLIGHRGLTHSLLAVLAGLAVLLALPPAAGLAGLAPPLAVGYLSHLAADALTPSGVPLLWPSRRRFGVALCSTGSAMEYLVVAALAGAAAWATGFDVSPMK